MSTYTEAFDQITRLKTRILNLATARVVVKPSGVVEYERVLSEEAKALWDRAEKLEAYLFETLEGMVQEPAAKGCPMPSHHPSCDCEGQGGDR